MIHTLVLEPGLKIYKIYMGYWYWGRPSIAERWTDLREIMAGDSGKCGPTHRHNHSDGEL